MAHSEATKAGAMAALLSGQSVGSVAERFGLPKQTVSRFKAALSSYLLETTTQQQRDRLGDLLFSCLETNLGALSAMATTCTTPEALAGQKVRDLVALHHSISDLVIRLLEIAWTSGLWKADRERGAQQLQTLQPERIQ